MTAARVRHLTDTEHTLADETAERGTPFEALAGWTGALVVGVSCWGVLIWAVGGVL